MERIEKWSTTGISFGTDKPVKAMKEGEYTYLAHGTLRLLMTEPVVNLTLSYPAPTL